MNKLRLILFALTGLTIILLSGFTILHSTGVTNKTGSPIDGGSCGDCHSGTGTATPSFTITANPAFGTGNTYLPGTSYTIDINCLGPFAKYGFDLELLNSTSPTSSSDAGVCGPALLNCMKVISAGNPTNYTHTTPTGTSNAATFRFAWTAPASGNVFIYAAVLGVNNNGATTGDHLKLQSLTLNQDLNEVDTYQNIVSGVNVFPNPVTDNIHVNYFLDQRGVVSIKLFDLSGKLVAGLWSGSQDRGVQSIDMRLPPEVAKGTYVLKVTVNGCQTIQKLFVL